MTKIIFSFDDKSTNKLKDKKNILGGKGANLGEMGRLGLPVPPGFTISTSVCDIFYKNKKKLSKKIINNIKFELKKIEKKTKKKFGDLKSPLLVSVRSGARISMPGMMDTILNLGLNDKTVESLKEKTNNAGGIFLGDYSTEAFGDYVVGTNHVLPTSGAAKFSSGLGVIDFMKKSSIVEIDKPSFQALSKHVENIADVENLDAHKLSVTIRQTK